METAEIWYSIPDYENHYELSSLLRIKSLKNGKGLILKQHRHKRTKYLSVGLSKNGLVKTFGVHVLVAKVHVPNPLNLPLVEHLNDIRDDNRPENLMWSTQKQNMKNASERGRVIGSSGERNGMSKLTEKDVLEIRASSLTQTELSKIYNNGNISRIISRKYWKHI